MNLELIAWLKDGKYRIKALELLSKNSFLSSELANELRINRASMSRILRTLKSRELVFATSGNSRTILYSITKKGKNILENLQHAK